ncbi:MAG: GtrA family protein [Alphaproteobacteria bacterium]|nr:GtrA family protein [Alphaproteobacteria bacterium]
MSPLRHREFLRFCMVGFLAFLVDSSLLELLVYTGLTAPVARGLSIAVALQCSYFLHGAFTFRAHGGYSIKSWMKFMLGNLMGAALNYGVFLLVLMAQVGADARIARLAALLAGTAVALLFNYWASRRFVFARREP